MPATHGSSSSSSSNFTPQIFASPVPFKLDEGNFLPWKQQALATVRGFRHHSYLLGEEVPQKFRSEEDEILGCINPTFTNWEQQDQLLMSWLLVLMSESMHNRMSKGQATYRVQLRYLKKEGNSISSYLLNVKKLVDALAAAGNPISVEEHIEAIFDSPNEEYDGFITSVISRSDPYSVDEIEALLLAQEERLEKHRLTFVYANFAQLNFQRGFNAGRGHRGRNQFTRGNSSFFNRGGRGYRGFGNQILI